MYYFQEKIVLMNFLLVLQILNHNTIGFHKSSICIKVSGAQSMADFRGLVLRTQPYVVSANNGDSNDGLALSALALKKPLFLNISV